MRILSVSMQLNGQPVADPKKLYDDVMMDHIKNARNYRVIDGATRKVDIVNPLCGDTMTLYLDFKDERIHDAAFQCSCCGVSMASASIMTEHVKGMDKGAAKTLIAMLTQALKAPREAALELEHGEMAIVAAVREFPQRVSCAALGWRALDAALDGCTERLEIS
jgi:nitrogen fixation protein NifU and related proteins